MSRLTAWEAITDPTDRIIAIVGDSTGERIPDAGGAPYPTLLRRYFQKRWGASSLGFRGTWRNEWAFTTAGNAWTESTLSDAWDCGPYRGFDPTFFPDLKFTATMKANGSAKVATYTLPSGTPSVTSFILYVVDGATSANFAYRIDGGAWTNVSHTWNQNNSLDRITISSAVTSTVEIRGANAAGTAVNVYLCGLEAIYGTGAVIHDLTASGERSYNMVRTTAGDALAWVDLLQPTVTLFMYTNDMGEWDDVEFRARLDTLQTRCEPYGPVIPAQYFEQDVAQDTERAEMNTQLASFASANDVPFVDMFTRYGTFEECDAAGYFDADGIHPSRAGSLEMARHNFWPILARGPALSRG